MPYYQLDPTVQVDAVSQTQNTTSEGIDQFKNCCKLPEPISEVLAVSVWTVMNRKLNNSMKQHYRWHRVHTAS